MSILEILGITWLVLIVVNTAVAVLARYSGNEEKANTDKKVNQAIDKIINQGIDIAVEIIEYSDKTIYYAYQNSNRKFLTQGDNEQQVLDNLGKKYGKLIKFQIVSKDYVGTRY